MSVELFAKTAKEAGAQRDDLKAKVWQAIREQHPEAAAHIREWQRLAKEAGEVGLKAVAFQDEWSDGRARETFQWIPWRKREEIGGKRK